MKGMKTICLLFALNLLGATAMAQSPALSKADKDMELSLIHI